MTTPGSLASASVTTPQPSLKAASPRVPPSGAHHGSATWIEPGELFDLVYRQMASLTAGRHGEFDDLVQLALEAVLKSRSSFEGRSALSTWVYGICYRTLLQHRRRYHRWLKRFSFAEAGSLPEPTDPSPDHLSALESRERVARLRVALQALSPQKRTVIVLKDLEGHSVAEIAEIVGAGELTVRSRLRDARKALLRVLRNDPFFGEEANSGGAP